MKKSLIALAVLAASGAAMAQSSVTLYGVADVAVTHVNGDDNWTGLSSGANKTSRLGFRGVEDLGGGLKANFVLEGGINLDTGDGKSGGATDSGFQFKRQSTVGLAGNFGEVRLGRMLTSSYLAVYRYDAFGDTGIGGSLAWKRAYPSRAENAISYTSPSFSGFKFGGEYGFGEKEDARTSRYIGVGAMYDNGPLSLGLGFDRINNVGYTAANPTALPPVAFNAGKDHTSWQLGGAYNFGVAKLLSFYKQSSEKTIANSNKDKFKTFGLGVTAPVGAAGEVKVAYNHYRLSLDAGDTQKANQLSLGYVHNLSKRTALYGTYAYVKNKNDNGRNLGLQLNGAMDDAGLSNSGAQHGLQLGVRHAF